ncbi:MAG: hypothetical protein RLZZ367_647, partial [Bacteroidota bacterium]
MPELLAKNKSAKSLRCTGYKSTYAWTGVDDSSSYVLVGLSEPFCAKKENNLPLLGIKPSIASFDEPIEDWLVNNNEDGIHLQPILFHQFNTKMDWWNRSGFTVIKSVSKSLLYATRIHGVVEEAKEVLTYGIGWDGEDALPIKKHSWDRAINFYTEYNNYIYQNFSVLISAPEINPGRDGSIDLVWKMDGAYFLINFCPTEKFEAHYYGDDGKDNVIIKGILYSDKLNEDIAYWMRK